MTNKNIYTFEKLTKEDKERCRICGEENKATYALRTRRIRDSRLMSYDNICDDCKLKFENDQLRKCEECERVFRWIDDKCKCVYLKAMGDDDENTDDEKKPTQDSQLEKQLHELSLEKSEVEEELEIERDAHLAGIEASGDWYRRKYETEIQELKIKIAKLEKERESLKELINNLKSQNLEREVKLESITTQTFDILDIPPRQETCVEIPPK